MAGLLSKKKHEFKQSNGIRFASEQKWKFVFFSTALSEIFFASAKFFFSDSPNFNHSHFVSKSVSSFFPHVAFWRPVQMCRIPTTSKMRGGAKDPSQESNLDKEQILTVKIGRVC